MIGKWTWTLSTLENKPITLYRDDSSGNMKNCPLIKYENRTLSARNSSKEKYHTSKDISVKGVKNLLDDYIDLPHPSVYDIEEFITAIKDLNENMSYFIQTKDNLYIGEGTNYKGIEKAKIFTLGEVKTFFENLTENEAAGYAVLDTTVKMGAVNVPNPDAPPGMEGSGDNFKEAITPSLFKAPGKKSKHLRRVKDYNDFLKVINYKTHGGNPTVGKSKSSKDGGHVYTGDPTP